MERRLLRSLLGLAAVIAVAAPAGAQYQMEITPGRAGVTASTSDINVPGNTVDNQLTTRWSGYGTGAWIRYDLGGLRPLSLVKIAFYRGHERRYRFTLESSNDNASWRPLLTAQSSGTTTAEETFDVPDSIARYVRYVGQGNTVNRWNSLTEVSLFQLVCPTPTAPPPPPPPTGLRAMPGDGVVTLQWWSFPNVRYEVGRSTTTGGPYASVSFIVAPVADSTRFTDTGLTNGTRYFYAVRRWASGTLGTPPCPVRPFHFPGPWSAEVSVVPNPVH